jgi:hypothetical protein
MLDQLDLPDARYPGRLRAAGRLVASACLAAVMAAPAVAVADNGVGAWSALSNWPLVPLHALVLPDGRVLSYGSNGDGTQTGRFIYDVWSPSYGLAPSAHWTLPNGTLTDLFCSAQIVLPQSGDVALVGGDIWNGARTTAAGNNNSNVFSAAAGDTLTRGANMRQARWYATLTTLPNGEIYVQGGHGVTRDRVGPDRPEIRDASGSFRSLGGIDVASLYWWYPRNWVAPDGRIFGFSDRTMYYVNPTGAGSLSIVGEMGGDGPTGVTSSEVMFAPGRILRVGGGARNASTLTPGKSAAAVIDINGASPVITPVGAMPVGLHWANATVMADGRVVVTGGGSQNNLLDGANYDALIWDPANPGVWTVGARTGTTRDHARLYHSIGMLLPNATILVGGTGANGSGKIPPANNTNAEIYYPPYLFTAAGEWAQRPHITQAPAVVTVGTSFAVGVDNPLAIGRVTLIKTGSVTHSFNMEQRFLPLPFTVVGNQLLVTAPANLNRAPPGRYMLFVLNAQGVPSLARIVAVAGAASPPLPQPFDGLRYVASYPDLIQGFGVNAAAGAWHYQQFGQTEGRVPDSFNARQYLANYADLRAAFGGNLQAATAHFISNGFYELRNDKPPANRR